MEKEEIKKIIPHREPMLLVDRVEKTEENLAVGEYTVKGDEWFLKDISPESQLSRVWYYVKSWHRPAVF